MKELLLSRGKAAALLDDDDYDRAVEYSKHWHVHTQTKKTWTYRYARTTKDGATLYLHRFVLHAPKGVLVDHIDSNGLNNQRSNLRLCTNTENIRNQRPKPGRLKGVYWSEFAECWMAVCGGRFVAYASTEELAAAYYNDAAREMFGDFARLNDLTAGN